MQMLQPHAIRPIQCSSSSTAEFLYEVSRNLIDVDYSSAEFVITRPSMSLVNTEARRALEVIARKHSIECKRAEPIASLKARMIEHPACVNCAERCFVFRLRPEKDRSTKVKQSGATQNWNPSVKPSGQPSAKRLKENGGMAVPSPKHTRKARTDAKSQVRFPPEPPSRTLLEDVVNGFVVESHPNAWAEGGCKVCGQLTFIKDSVEYRVDLFDHSLLHEGDLGVTAVERTVAGDVRMGTNEPVLDPDCTRVCNDCLKTLSNGNIPELALVNGNWIGAVPAVLQGLSWAEKMLVARVTSNRCIAQVGKSKFSKMTANAIFFESPIPKVHKVLPPPKSELAEVLAYVFMGPSRPTVQDHVRTPLLVNKKKVANALEWLKLNHCDYFDLEISYENLSEYPDDMSTLR